MSISLIHPSRGRAFKSLQTIKKWRANLWDYHNFELIVSIDDDEPEAEKYSKFYIDFPHEIGPPVTLITSKNRSAIDAINVAAKRAKGNILVVVSDDTDCTYHWDRKIYEETVDCKDWILKTTDGVQPWIITNPIMDRIYYNRFGYIYHPDYKHMFCDTELTCVADLTGRKITSNILFKHNHYSVTKEQPDEISKRADKTWDQGEKLFLERYKRNFDLPPDQIKGKIQDNGMIQWLERKHAISRIRLR